jgi:FkbM family methyltransferase
MEVIEKLIKSMNIKKIVVGFKIFSFIMQLLLFLIIHPTKIGKLISCLRLSAKLGVLRQFRILFFRIRSLDQNMIIWNFVEFSISYLGVSKSADYQDIVVLFLTGNLKQEKFFLEIGAFDGVYKSNCYLLELTGWKGLAVEPNTTVVNFFHKQRSAELLSMAVVENRNSDKVYNLIQGKRESSSFIQMSDELQLSKVMTISTAKLKDIFYSKFYCEPTYLSLDIEGMDSLILNEFFLINFFPIVISIEYNNIESEFFKIKNFSSKYGYEIVLQGLCRNDLILVNAFWLSQFDIHKYDIICN